MYAGKIDKPYGGADAVATLWTGQVTLPDNLMGMHFHRLTSPARTYGCSLWRTHDHEGLQWRDIHTAPWEFSVDRFETALAYAHTSEVCLTIWGTPRWCSTKPDEPDPYGGYGGKAPPNSQGPLRDFVTFMLNRFPGRIKFVECWNEPDFFGNGGFWTGTASDMAEMAHTVREAAHAVDPSIKMLGPSFSGFQEVADFLAASDKNGGYGRDHIDGVAWHPYSTNIEGFPRLNRYADMWRGDAHDITKTVREKMRGGGLPDGFPLYAMEMALAGADNDDVWQYTPEMVARYVCTATVLYAVLGWQRITWYSHDHGSHILGQPTVNAIVSRALDWCHALAGKDLRAVERLSSGALRVAYDAGGHLGYMVF